MKRNLTCIICPRGCSLTAEILDDGSVKVSGNSCPKGAKYATDELTHPTRTVTSTVRVSNRPDTMVSVKTEEPVPKEHIFDTMKLIRNAEIKAPVSIGDTILNGVYGTKVIATKNIG